MRGRSVLDGALAWVAIAVAFGLIIKFGGIIAEPGRSRPPCGISLSGRRRHGGQSSRHVVDHRVSSVGASASRALSSGSINGRLYNDLVVRSGELTSADMVMGIAALLILIYLVWQVMGIALPIVATVFLAYCLIGNWLPAPLDHRGYTLEQVIEHMSFGTEGIYAVPTLVSATYIFLFILFGAFMEKAGVIDFFNDISMAAFGGKQGGPGKVCVASSALMGTVSGSGVANVVASGQFTIPLMKRFGFPSAFAGGVEATSSMGGQIMPPVMGAVAFIMAETIDVPYAKIVEAAIIPAILYFAACYLAVHLEAGKRHLKGLPKRPVAERPGPRSRRTGFSSLRSASSSICSSPATRRSSPARSVCRSPSRSSWASPSSPDWPCRLSASSSGSGLRSCRPIRSPRAYRWWWLVVAVLAIWNAFSGRGRLTLQSCIDAMADGARQALPVGLACAVVGIVIGTMTLTGLGTIVGTWMISIGKDNMFLALVLTMIFSLILGMGIPTIPNYIITSSLAAPILLNLDVPLIVSHMFVFYFGIMADLTPPVALAAFAAAPMAKVSGMKIGVQAIKIALPVSSCPTWRSMTRP